MDATVLNIILGMVLYSAVSSPLDRSKRFTLSSPGRPVHSDTNSASLGSILAMQQLRNDYSLTCPPLSIAVYSFIQLGQLGVVKRNKMPKLPNSIKGDSNPGSLDCGSGILPLSYTALHISRLGIFESTCMGRVPAEQLLSSQ